MNVLIDYDNVRQSHRNKGLVYLADRLLQILATVDRPTPRRLRVRLYGGWYEEHTPSRRAQALAVEVLAEFPRVLSIEGLLVRVDMELAYGLEIEPNRHLLHTYRPQGAIANVECHTPAAAGCARMPCVLEGMRSFLSGGTCPDPSCFVEPNDILYRRQQKLVDTMLAVDLMFLAQNEAAPLCIVSSDDDFWPAVRTALVLGKRVIHVHTIAGHTTSTYYSAGAGLGYIETPL